jgi:hypothetical protein
MRGAAKFTRASILTAMNKVKGFTADGLIPSLDFSAKPPNASYPRIFNLTYYAGVVQNGKIAASGKNAGKATPVFCSGK